MTSKLLENIIQTRCGGAVERCHGIRHLGSYSNAMHQWGVTHLLWALYPEDFGRLAQYTLFHDVGEAWFGDIPAPTMRYVPGIKEAIHKLESNACEAYGLPREDALSPEDHAKVKVCDRLELLLWCKEQILMGNRFAGECCAEIIKYMEATPMDDRATALFKEICYTTLPEDLLPKQAGVVQDFVKANEPKTTDVYERLKKILMEHLNLDPERITPTASLIDDMGADSLDQVELVMACEEEFGIEIPDSDAEKVNTVQDMVDYLKSQGC
jgi:acyl carrier protein